jgi:hypothetical protein
VNWLRAFRFMGAHFAVVGVARFLTFVGSWRLAERVCRRGALWLEDPDLEIEVAFVHSRTGDVEGALGVLERFPSLLPDNQWRLVRAIYSGIICEANHQGERAARFFAVALAEPSIPDATKVALQARIQRVRSGYSATEHGA